MSLREPAARAPKWVRFGKNLPAAREVVNRAERIVLTERDTTRVLHLLENPPSPTPALLAAASRRLARN